MSEAPLLWTVNLGAQAPSRRWIVLAAAFGTALVGYGMFRSPVMALIGFAAIVASATEVLFPLRYRLDSRGATVRCGLNVTTIAWENVKRVVRAPDGLKLSPLDQPSRLEAFRGVYLRFGDRESEVVAAVERFWRSDGTLATGT